MTHFVLAMGYILALAGLFCMLFNGAIVRFLEPRPTGLSFANVLRTMASLVFFIGGRVLGFILLVVGGLLIALGYHL
jgi:hypothetical protein